MSGRRMNGEGSVYQRASDGRWVGAVVLGYSADGKLQRKTVSARTKAEVLTKIRSVQQHQDAGLPPTDDRMTVAQLIEQWHRNVLKHQVAASAADNYKTIADNHIVPAIGRKRVAKLRPEDVDHLIADTLANGYSVSTARRVRGVLSQALDQAVRWGRVPRNVATMTRQPRGERPSGRALTPEQARQLLEACKTHRLGVLYATMLTLGLRRGEALGLSWDDVDLENRVVAVRRAAKLEDGKVILGDVKTLRSRRSIDLPPQLVKLLRGHRVQQKADRLKAGKAWARTERWPSTGAPGGLVFITAHGTPIDPRNVYRDFTTLTERAGLGRWHPHELRHSAASLMLAQRVPVEVVAEVLGHSSIRVTADVYGHISPPQRQGAARAMAGVLWRT